MALKAIRYIYFMDVEPSVEDFVFPKRPIRVLRVISRMNVGGPAIQIKGLMTQIPQQQFSQLLVTGYCEDSESDYLDAHDIHVPLYRIKNLGRSLNFLHDVSALFELRKIMKIFRPDIVHTHTAKAGLLGRLASLSTFDGHIRVHTFHGHLLHGYFGSLKTKLIILVERFLAQFTDSLVAVGCQVRNDLLNAKIGNMGSYRVIGPGLEIRRLTERTSSLNSFELPHEQFFVTWIGRAVSVKAPHRILEIAAECVLRGLKVQFVIVGEGPLLSDLYNLAREKELPVAFLGWQSDIEKILSFSDLVLLTSKNEGTPVALIQAQMAGIPVLTTNVGSTSEVMINEKSGFCLHYSAQDFADKIELLVNNEEIKISFGAIGKINARDKFSLARLISDHQELYFDLIREFRL
jgi:glycosyltransferase involved in cell wall biosynthesis